MWTYLKEARRRCRRTSSTSERASGPGTSSAAYSPAVRGALPVPPNRTNLPPATSMPRASRRPPESCGDPRPAPPGTAAIDQDRCHAFLDAAARRSKTASCSGRTNSIPPTCPATQRTMPSTATRPSNLIQSRSPTAGRSMNSILQPFREASKTRTRKACAPERRIFASVSNSSRRGPRDSPGSGASESIASVLPERPAEIAQDGGPPGDPRAWDCAARVRSRPLEGERAVSCRTVIRTARFG